MAIELSEKQIKDGWQIVKFGEIAMNISKRVEPSETDLDVYVGLEHLDPQSLRITRRGVPADVKGQKLRVRPGQIIFGKRRAYQKKVAVADFEGICSAHAMVLEEVVGKIIPGLLPFFMQSEMFMDRAVAISEGSLSPTIKWKTLAIQEFPLPPIERQKEILEVLEKSKALSENYLATVQSGKKLKKSLIHNVLNNRSISTTVKGVKCCPQGWKVLKLSECVNFQGGTQPPRDKFQYTYSDNSIRLIQIRDYKNDDFIVYIPKELAKNECDENDVMIGRYGPPVFQILRGLKGSYNVALIKATPKKEIGKDYFFYVLQDSHLFHYIDVLSRRSAGQTGIDMDALKKYPIFIPPLEVQKKHVASLKLLETKIELLSAQRDKVLRFLNNYIHEVHNELQ